MKPRWLWLGGGFQLGDGRESPLVTSCLTGRHTDDPFLTPGAQAPVPPSPRSPIPGAVLRGVPGGHGPWLEDPAGCAKLVTGHLTATGFAPVI